MRSLKELCCEITESEELKKEFAQAVKDKKIEAFFTKHGCDAGVKELKECLSAELKDEQLAAVSGGLADGGSDDLPDYWSSLLDNFKKEYEIDPRKFLTLLQ